MPLRSLQPGTAFRFRYLWTEADVFLFAFPCDLVKGDGLFRRFNMRAGFIEPEWYRFPLDSPYLTRAPDCDWV